MEINVVEETKNKIVLKIDGSGHTICNVLKDELKNTKGVKVAAYRIDHPLTGVPQIMVETDGKLKPAEAIKKALKKISADTDKLKKSAEKALK